MPPTPIANIPASAIGAVLNFVASSYLYYLHDNDGGIWWADTLEKHNSNKAQYLR
ncbi:endolytic transglycosylase MltG [Patescibacteria group bacterium]|nr:endolytic transglycosylase MltG [Patescibacteria group bacterium]MBP7841439.1 endolytic transglycosylase MltG [Patescibacteria group bacterium]